VKAILKVFVFVAMILKQDKNVDPEAVYRFNNEQYPDEKTNDQLL